MLNGSRVSTVINHSKFGVTHLLPTAVEECQGVYPILYDGAYDGYPMEDDWRIAFVTREELKCNTSNEFQKTRLCGGKYKLAEHIKNDDHCWKYR
jgi:hypothetical protein